jgi:hypothetical protein
MLTVTFDRIRNNIENSLAKFAFDSADKKEPEAPEAAMMVKTLKALVGAEFKFKMSPLGVVSDIQVPKTLLDSAKTPGAPVAPMFTEDGWKNMIKELSVAFPETDLETGKGWNIKGEIPLGPGASLGINKIFTYQGASGTEEKVAMDVKTTLNSPPAESKIFMKLDAPNGKGTLLFDNAKGRVIRAEIGQKISLNVKAGGLEDTQSNETTNVMTLVDTK